MNEHILNALQEINEKNPVELIIRQIKDLILNGELKPGDRLPAERNLSAKLKVGRGYVREAIKKLEIYGIIETWPQSGSYISRSGFALIEGIVANLVVNSKSELPDLIETRIILESKAAELTASTITAKGKTELKELHSKLSSAIINKEPGYLKLDLLFHLKIAELCPNRFIRSFITMVTPEVYRISDGTLIDEKRPFEALKEHQQVLDSILAHESNRAGVAMRKHVAGTLQFLKVKN